ncbi:MAG: hypothetical protein LCI00_13390 [Chloroflexi bacterium]|nr:hypothetical protein [Chloroflexota bacterium]MCC6892344.1 hypothetical protein [Anaerolineae bacterium]
MTKLTTRQRAFATFIALMTAVLLLAAAFRVYHIIQRPIWTDEGTTTFNLFHFNGQTNLIDGLAARDHHPPLYYLLMQAWVGLTGDSIFAMRYFAALAGILSVALMVPLARVILTSPPSPSLSTPPLAPPRSNREGNNTGGSQTAADEDGIGQRPWLEKAYWFVPLTAALVLALSDPDIDLGQEIRFYTLRTLLVILSAFFYLHWVRKPSKPRALLWLAANVAILHTNYQGAFIMAFEGLHALIFLRGRLRLAAIGWLALSGVFFLPWFIGYGYGQFDNEQGVNSTLPSTWDTFVELTYKFLGRMWPLMLGLMLLGVASRQSPVVSQEEISPSVSLPRLLGRVRVGVNDRVFLLVAWIGLTLIISFVANEWFSILSPRRVMLISPAIALLVALGLARLNAQTRVFLLAVILVYSATSVDDYYPKAPWDKVGADMGRYAEAGDMALMEIYYDDTVLYYYTDHDMPPGTVVKSLRMWRQFEGATYPNGVIDLLNQHKTVWFTHWSPDQSGFDFLKQTGHVQTALMTTYWGTNALNVYRYDAIQPEPVVDYSNGMRLRQFAIHPDEMRVDLWWSAEQPLDQDYSVSVFLLDANGQLVAQKDDFPFLNQRPTTGWQAGEVVFDPHTLELPSPPAPLPQGEGSHLPAGTYSVGVKLYTYFDGQQYPTVNGDDWQIIGTLER